MDVIEGKGRLTYRKEEFSSSIPQAEKIWITFLMDRYDLRPYISYGIAPGKWIVAKIDANDSSHTGWGPFSSFEDAWNWIITKFPPNEGFPSIEEDFNDFIVEQRLKGLTP